jgi:ParB/RepB/Spo0J family partition protein
MKTRAIASAPERDAPLGEISEAKLGTLRLRTPELLSALERSLKRHGQLEPVVVFGCDELLEVVDGFKRLHLARQLGWERLRVRVCELEPVEAKLLLPALHAQRGLSALEEAWLLVSLYRDHGLSQGRIAAELGKHKSWVCRRLLLVEQLAETVQTQVRLGLVAPRAAMALAALPRGNQKAAADIVTARALTVRQTELLVADVLDCEGAEQLAQRLAQWKEEGHRVASARKPSPAKLRSEADWMCLDITTLRATGARLEARLLGTPLPTLGEGPSSIVRRGLEGLVPVLDALAKTVAGVMQEVTPPKNAPKDKVA